jgi:hypothetical protein
LKAFARKEPGFSSQCQPKAIFTHHSIIGTGAACHWRLESDDFLCAISLVAPSSLWPGAGCNDNRRFGLSYFQQFN